MIRKVRNQTSATLPYAFCEPGDAIAMGKEHLRRLSPDTPSRGAGFPPGTEALCGRDLHFGWDLPGDVTAPEVELRTTPRPGDGQAWLCPRCTDAFGQENPH